MKQFIYSVFLIFSLLGVVLPNSIFPQSSEVNFDKPYGCTHLSDDNVIITDEGLKAVISIDHVSGTRTVLSQAGVKGAGPAFGAPRFVAALDHNTLLVSDVGLDAILGVDLSTGDRTILSSSTIGTGPAFSVPMGIAILNATTLMVADYGMKAILSVDLNTGNRLIVSSSTMGTGSPFSMPTGITLLNSNTLIVSDSGIGAILSVDLNTGDRTIVSSPTTGTGPLFQNPVGIVIHNASFLLVSASQTIFAIHIPTGDRSIFSRCTNDGIGISPFPGDISLTSDGRGSLDLILADEGSGRVLRIRTDRQCEVLEETNQPDYIAQFTGGPSSVSPGQTVSFSIQMTNQGAANGNTASQSRYYLSTDNQFNAGLDLFLNQGGADDTPGIENNPAINAGESITETENIIIPNGTPNGDYYILYVVDYNDDINESNETNNLAYYRITIGGGGSPDYIPVNFRLNNSTNITVNSGQSVSGSLFAKNQGSGPGTVNASGKYYFSYDNNFDGGDQVIGVDDIEPLSPGQETPETENVTIPNGLGVGTYYVFYKVDADNVINESNEGNNTAYVTVSVQGSPPNANFSASNTSPCLTSGQTETISFNDQSSGSPTSYSWNFGTPNIIYMNGTNSTSQNPQVKYTAAGTYTVSLTISNASGSDSEIKSNYINVSSCATAPVAEFTPSNNTPCVGDVVTLFNQTTGGATAYLWSFNPANIIYLNGTNATSANPQVRFNIAATYVISLTATNSAGSNTKTKNVVVSTCQTAPIANFTSDRTTICPSESMQFSSTSTGSPTSYNWSFPGGSPSSSTSPSPVVSYATPGSYMVSLTVSNSAGSNTKQVAGYITVQSVGCGGGPNWPVTQTVDNHTVIIETSAIVTVNGQPISIGDYVGAFYDDNGTQKCAGKTVWTGSNTFVAVYGDDNSTAGPKEGFANGEVFKWKIWKASANEEMNAIATYKSPNGIITHTNQFAENGLSSFTSLTGSTEQTQTIVLRPGWNTISSYIQPQAPNLVDIFSPIQDQIALVKNGSGNIYFPSSAINTIGNWNVPHGYQVKVLGSSSINLQVVGQQVDLASTVINLNVGWNLFAYLRDTEQSIATALSPVESKLIIAKNNSGQIYFPSGSINNIGNMKPGQGYQVRMSDNESLHYNTRMASPPANMYTARLVPNHFHLRREQNGNNASLIITNNDVLNMGDEVGVFTEKGMLVGAAVYEGHTLAFPIWGDELNTSEVEGLEEGATFEVKILNSKTQKEEQVELFFKAGDQVYHTDGIIQASLQKTTNISSLLEANSLNIYPNPSKTQATLSLGLMETVEIKVELYNLQGKLIKVVSEERLAAGNHEINISTAHFPNGLYHCAIIIGDVVHNISLAVMK